MKGYIRISLRVDEMPEVDLERVVPFELSLDRVMRAPIDVPDIATYNGTSSAADLVIETLLCTPKHVIEEVLKERQPWSTRISAAEMFLEYLSSSDTIMGYPKGRD